MSVKPLNNSPNFRRASDEYKRQQNSASRWQGLVFPDKWLLLIALTLIVIGVVMVTSASINEADDLKRSVYFYTNRQVIFYIIGLVIAYICFSVPTTVFMRSSGTFLAISFILLLLIYVPGLGMSINGARRWLNLRFFQMQVGEIVKLTMILYAAAFLQKNQSLLKRSWLPILELLGICGVFAGILLLQPDFGTTMVMVATVLGLLFLSGVSMSRFMVMGGIVLGVMIMILISARYRVERLMIFLDPWVDPYDKGYQLVNSLIAIGNGSLFGVGLGQSVQKHNYLPEAHTDFIFSIICEELGLIGAIVIICLFILLVWRAFVIGKIADLVRRRYAALVSYGIGLLIAIQALVNIGVTTGSLPTKGLTLPLISYGGSSVIMTCIALGILARIDAESRFQAEREGLL